MTDDTTTPLHSRVQGPPTDYPFDDGYAWEDEYPTIHDEDIAYAVFDWDTLDPELVERHDGILELSLEEASALDLDRLNDLHRWAVARVYTQHGELARAVEVCDTILATTVADRCIWLSYPDIHLERARKLTALQRFDEALAGLHRCRGEDRANEREVARYVGVVTLLAGDRQAGLALLLEAIHTHAEHDPEMALHLGDELVTLGRQEAVEVYTAGMTIARSRNMADLLAELEDALEAAEASDLSSGA